MTTQPDIAGWRGLGVLVLGDVMVDRFVYGRVERISPEGPVPVLRHESERVMLGGAGNVARNIASLGGDAILVGVVGRDDAGDAASGRLVAEEGIRAHLVRGDALRTTVKTRFVADGQQMLRLDVDAPVAGHRALAAELFGHVRACLADVRAVVLSDYAKGVLGRELTARVIALARERAIPVIVDPKRRDLSVYRGASVLTPNASEARTATGYDPFGDDGAALAVRRIRDMAEAGAVVLTRGARGMTIFAPHDTDEPTHLPTVAAEVFDVSGAGDTVAAALALGMASGLSVLDASRLANTAAAIAVRKRGTAAVHAHELVHALQERSLASLDHKILANGEACAAARTWHAQGLKVGFTNGCFDLVHPGHMALLRGARAFCDRLVVALNSDASVARLKGPTRPVQSEIARAVVMASISAVDLVTVFDQDTPLELITALRPDVLIKGADYKADEVVGGELVKRSGGRVVLIDIEAGHSTTGMITRAAS